MYTSPPLKLTAWMSLFLLAFSFGCDDDSIAERTSSLLEISPASFNFPAAQPGDDPIDRIVTIKNIGLSDLKLAQVTASFNDINAYLLDYRKFDPAAETPDAGDFLVGLDASGNSFPNNITIEPDLAVAFKLRYTPIGAGASGVVKMDTNTSQGEIEIPVEGSVAQGDVTADPGFLDFGRVNVGDEKTMSVRLTNVGSSVALINNVFLNATDEFSVSLGDDNAVGSMAEVALLGDPDGDMAPGLSPRASVEFEVTYRPTSDISQPGTLVFALGQSRQDQISVDLVANGASPCINLVFPDSASSDNDTLQFGPSLIGATTPSEVIVESCGGQALEVTSITYEGDEEFALAGDAMPFNLPARSETFPSQSFTVNFSPLEAEVYEGTLIIASNDPANPELRIPVIGRGTVNACPEAVVAQDRLDVLPLDIITLDASNSVDIDGPNGSPVSYEWVVIERPDGSTAQPVERFFNRNSPADGGDADDPSTPTAQFFVDLAGVYVFQLVVTDDLGFSAPSNSCPQPEANVTVNSLPDEDIHVELTWTTPGDPNETDSEGTDVDLHFRHPNGQRWNQSPYDCYFANPNPDWGPTGMISNPSLDIDDVNGAGPENINLNDPEFTDLTTIPGPYLVGVHYYSPGGLFTSDYGYSDATIRIYLSGVLADTYTRRLNIRGNFWEVAGVIWTANDQRVQGIDRFYDSPPW